jgi:hypothetical protein
MARGTLSRHVRASSVSLLLLIALACPLAGKADTIIFDNLNTPSPDSMLDVKFNQWDAQSFTVGPSNIQLSLAELNLATASNTSGNFFVKLYSNSGTNMPATPLEALIGSTNPAAAGIYGYNGSTLLTANTTYWIVAQVTAGQGLYKWNFELPPNVEQGQTLGAVISTNQGNSWILLDGPATFDFNMRVSGVPEPSGILLATLGFAAAVGFKIRRRAVRQN